MRALLLLLLPLVLLSACTSSDDVQSEVMLDTATVAQEGDPNANLSEITANAQPSLRAANAPPPPSGVWKMSDGTSGFALASAALPVEAAGSRMVIRNADLRLTVASPESAAVDITRLAEARGGYVTESRQWHEGETTRAHLTLRVPAERLTDALEAIRGIAVRVENESVTGQDVTAEYTDLSAQLTNLETAETELRELLSTTRERSQRASDILEVYNQLTHIRGEVERVKGRIQYLSQMTAYSTIQIDLYRDRVAEPIVAAGWRPVVAAREAGAALVRTLQDAAEFGIWLAVYALPLLGLIALPLYGLYRLLRSWRPRPSPVVTGELDA